MHVAVLFTWDVSLKLWQEKGLLERELRLYEALHERGVQFTFFTWGDESDRAIDVPFARIVPLYTLIPKPKSQALRFVASLLAPFKLKRHMRDIDLLKTNQMWGGWVATLLRLLWRKPLLVRAGFELYDFTMRQGHGPLRRAFTKWISRMTYHHGDHIFLATAEDKAFVENNFLIDGTHITLQPNWINTDLFRPISLPEKENTILYIGRLEEQKNLPALIEATAQTGYRLDIIGQGSMRKQLEAIAQDKGAKIRFLDPVPNDALPEIYNAYPLYVLCSHYEGNPKTLLEAMACGRPVLGSRAPGIQSVIEEGKTGYLCDTDTGSIAAALTYAMNDPRALQMGAAARDFILHNQTLDKAVEREITCYQKLVEESVA